MGLAEAHVPMHKIRIPFFLQCPGCSSQVSTLDIGCISMCSAWGQVNWSWASWNEHQVSWVLVKNNKINDNRKLLMGDFGQTSPRRAGSNEGPVIISPGD